MNAPPEGEHHDLRTKLRVQAVRGTVVSVSAADLITLLDYVDNQDQVLYDAWENAQGEDL